MADPPVTVDLANRLALRVPEAAQVLGVSKRKLREMLPRLPVVRDGGTVLLPVAELRRWLADTAREQQSRADRVAAEILQLVGDG